jgi:hypothetical protein
MVIAQIKVRCKNPNCDGVRSLQTITFDSEDDLLRWVFAFQPQKIECPVCHSVETYFGEHVSADYSIVSDT